MKSSVIGNNHARRAKILTDLVQMDFRCLLLIADKQAFALDSPLAEYKATFVKFLHQRLYSRMYSAYPKLKISEDEYGTEEFQQGYKKYVEAHRPASNLFGEYDFYYVNSKNSNIVQIADIIAGSVRHQLEDTSAPKVLDIFQGKIVDIVNFPESFQLYRPQTIGASSSDNAIFVLAVKCAKDYINSNQNDDSLEIAIRVFFLKYLLFNATMYPDSRYIYADEIVSELSRLFHTRIKRDYLYRRIVAPLRDDGVIIASSSHGYKIPKTLKDIETYISQTTTVVGPMLSRIGKCRDLIRMNTNARLDILNDPSLAGYRRFFGDY